MTMLKLRNLFTLALLGAALGAFAWARPSEPAASAEAEHGSQAAPSAAAVPEATSGSGAEANHEDAKNAGKSEASEEDGFKYSPVVEKLGHMIGLDVKQAYWVSLFLNFIFVAVLLGLLMKSNLPRIFRDRTSLIQKGMEEARRASAEATARLTSIESRLARLDGEIQQMTASAEQEAHTEEERLKSATEVEKRKIVEAAGQEIATASNIARRELRQFAAELSVSLAAKKISVSESDDKQLIEDFASQLGATHSDASASSTNDGAKGGR